jgi:hypothetical protein
MPNEFIARNGLISLSSVQITGSATITGSLAINGSPVILSSQTSSISLTSGQITTGLGYTPYNSTNPNGYTTNTGTVTSVGGTGTVSGLTLTGTVTGTGNLTLGGTLSLTSGQITTGLGYTPYNSTNPNGYTTNTGTVTSVGTSGGYGGLTLTGGTITTTGTITLGGTPTGTWPISISGTAASISGFGNPTTSATGNTIVYRDPNGYLFGNYINMTDDGNPGSGTSISSFITKQNDNYYRSVSPTNAMVSIRGVASGTWGISISGGLTATQANLGYSVSGVNIDYGGHGGPQVQSQGGGAAMMSFHRPGAYAINFGLGTDNQLRTGGWSRGGNYLILDAGNYNGYAPTLTGTGASGTWGISITGNANTATTATNLSGFDKTNPSFGAVYSTNWFRSYGDTGLYNQDYACHLRRSTAASFGTWEMFGYNKGGYGGLNIIDPSGYWNNFMFENGNGGLYQQNGSGWVWLHNRTYGSFAIGPSAVVSASYRLYVEGNIYATGVVDWASDVRKKENIETIDSALDKVKNLRGVYFNRIDDPNKKTQTGVIAQEVKEIMPELVNYDDMNDSYSVTYGNFAGLFIEAIKEQQKQIESLKQEIETLKNK